MYRRDAMMMCMYSMPRQPVLASLCAFTGVWRELQGAERRRRPAPFLFCPSAAWFFQWL